VGIAYSRFNVFEKSDGMLGGRNDRVACGRAGTAHKANRGGNRKKHRVEAGVQQKPIASEWQQQQETSATLWRESAKSEPERNVKGKTPSEQPL
jgi:hypothetical protein